MKRQNRHFVDEGVSPNGILRESSTGGVPYEHELLPIPAYRIIFVPFRGVDYLRALLYPIGY